MTSVSTALKPIHDNWEWQYKGACNGTDSEVFFLESNLRGKNKLRSIDAAKSICATCPVKKECLEHALAVPEDYGVWGGLSEEERVIILSSRGFKPEYTRIV